MSSCALPSFRGEPLDSSRYLQSFMHDLIPYTTQFDIDLLCSSSSSSLPTIEEEPSSQHSPSQSGSLHVPSQKLLAKLPLAERLRHPSHSISSTTNNGSSSSSGKPPPLPRSLSQAYSSSSIIKQPLSERSASTSGLTQPTRSRVYTAALDGRSLHIASTSNSSSIPSPNSRRSLRMHSSQSLPSVSQGGSLASNLSTSFQRNTKYSHGRDVPEVISLDSSPPSSFSSRRKHSRRSRSHRAAVDMSDGEKENHPVEGDRCVGVRAVLRECSGALNELLELFWQSIG